MADPLDFDFPLLPPDPGVVSPDVALDAALAPVVDFPDVSEQEPFGKGWLFDFMTSQFVRHGLSPAEVYETDNLAVWIQKVLRTAKFAHPIYDETYGMPEPFALIGQPFSTESVGDYQQSVVETLLAHDRIAAADDFTFFYDPMDDVLFASFTVTTDAVPPQVIQVDQLPLMVG